MESLKAIFVKILFSILLLDHVMCHNYDRILEDAVKSPLVGERTRGQPWPLPQEYGTEPTFFTIKPNNFEFLHSSKCDIIISAIQRYKKIIFLDNCVTKYDRYKKEVPENIGELYNLTIKITGGCETYPYMNMDEQYLLKVNTPDYQNQALLFSTTIWGALRGLETFSQTIYQIDSGLFAINTSIILDFPRFSFRGLLLDTSRHFIPVPVILQNLDAMAQTKLNVFHWHIVDDPSFPYVSKTFPGLSNQGAFNSETHVYSQADVAHVIEYARLRGIRVLAEFDTPGHTLSWGKNQTDLLTACYSGEFPNGKFGPVDPTMSSTYKFFKNFFKEVSEVFPDNYMHLGGDEVDFDCWKSNPFVQNFMRSMSFGDNFALLEQYYMQNILNIVKSMNKSYIVWQEVFDNQVKLKPDTVIHVWKDGYQSELANVTAAGYHAILSSCWYLNYVKYGIDWPSIYTCEPYDFNGTNSQKRLIMGGEACMWGEFVDASNIFSRTWPRAAAVAERLWSNKTVTDVAKAAPRMEELHCNMIKRGLKVEPINGPGYCPCDYLMQ